MKTVIPGSANISFEEISDFNHFLQLEMAWNDLHAQSFQSDDVFLTHEWLSSWWTAFGDKKQLYVLLVKKNNDLVAACPLMIYKEKYNGLSVTTIGAIENYHSHRYDFLVKESYDIVIPEILNYLLHISVKWDIFCLNFLPHDSKTLQYLKTFVKDLKIKYVIKPSYYSPYIYLDSEWPAYYGSLNGRFLRNLRNREKRIFKIGNLYLAVKYSKNIPHECLQQVFEIGRKSWKEKQGTAIGSTNQYRSFYTELFNRCKAKSRIIIFFLMLDEKAIAFHYSLKFKNTLYLLKTEYDLDYKKYSPGHLIQKQVIKYCFDRSIDEYEFLGEDLEWKREWTKYNKKHVNLLIFNKNIYSRLLGFGELRIKKPIKQLLKNTIHE